MRQTLDMVEEATKTFKMSPPIVIFENDEINKLKQFCSGRVPVLIHPSFYRALKLTYPWNIVSLSYDGTIKNEIGQE